MPFDVKEPSPIVAEYLRKITENICPICDEPGEPKQVGHCVYGACGHRWYQGELPKKKESK